jgi:CBS domain-containing protein
MRPITASDLMNPEVLTVREDMAVRDLAAFLVDNEITGAPVEDENGKLVGVVSVVDVAEVASESASAEADRSNPDFYERSWEESLSDEEVEEIGELAGEDGDELVVRDIMTPMVYSVAEEDPVSAIASLMLEAHLHRVLVTRGDKVVGIITTSDLLGLLVEEA